MKPSSLVEEAVHHPFLAGLVEIDGDLVAFDGGDRAGAELDVEHPVADGKLRCAVDHRLGNQLALDQLGLRPAIGVLRWR